jgi:hypothetical protein
MLLLLLLLLRDFTMQQFAALTLAGHYTGWHPSSAAVTAVYCQQL